MHSVSSTKHSFGELQASYCNKQHAFRHLEVDRGAAAGEDSAEANKFAAGEKKLQRLHRDIALPATTFASSLVYCTWGDAISKDSAVCLFGNCHCWVR